MAGNPRTFAVVAAEEVGEDRLQWIEVMPTADKARNGRFYFTVTRDDLDSYAEYIHTNGERIVVDYDHEGADGGSTVAAGWFTGEEEVRDTDQGPRLYAQVEWTPQGFDDIQSKRFRFISPEFSFAKKDTKTGLMTKAKAIIAATLTNRPFFTELAAVAADDGPVLWDADQGVNQLQTNIAAALNPGADGYDDVRFWVCDVDVAGKRALVTAAGPGDDAWIVPYTVDADGNVTVPPTVDWVPVEQAWVADTDDGPGMAALADRFTALANHISERITAHGGEAAMTERNGMNDSLKAVAAELGLADDATDTQVLDAVKATKAAKPADDAVILDKSTVEQLTASAKKGEQAHAELATLKVKTLLDEAVRDFKILPAQRAAYEAMCDADFDGIRELLEATPKDALKVAARGAGGAGREDGEPSSDEIEAVRARFSGENADEIDDDQARIHLKAVELIGKPDYTATEYATAFAAASRELGVVYRERPRE